ncbi:MAG: cytochrome b5 [Syntrophaceae bacterium]|nr:cytochrome b5 [Syntrophaceae bacterium]
MKEFDRETLKEFNGKDGKPVHVAYKGRVIDVTGSKFWKTGVHMKRHSSGTDLTADIEAAPHGPEVLDRYPQVGVLKEKEETAGSMPEWLAGLLDRFPILRRHPHPMVVHFPIVFTFSSALFNLLYLVTGHLPFETTAFHCLGGGVLFAPVAILTGYFTWWLNYLAKPLRAVTLKIRFSFFLWVLSILLFIWRMYVPEIIRPLAGGSFVYLLLVFSLVPVVTVIGWFGATLTFPVEKK